MAKVGDAIAQIREAFLFTESCDVKAAAELSHDHGLAIQPVLHVEPHFAAPQAPLWTAAALPPLFGTPRNS